MRITKKSTTFVLFLALGAGTSSAQEPPRGAVCNREAAVTFGRDRRTAPDSSATETGTFFAYWHKSGCDRLKNEGRSSDACPAFELSYPDSNQEKQDQNLLCYHYTIAQCPTEPSVLRVRSLRSARNRATHAAIAVPSGLVMQK